MEKLIQSRFWKFLEKFEIAIMAITAALTVIIMFGETALRAIHININGFEEYLLIIVFWMYMIGAAYGSRTKTQITADFIDMFMKDGTIKNILILVKYVLTFVLGAIFLWWAFDLLLWGIETGAKTSLWRIPFYTGYASIFVGLVLITFYNLVYLLEYISTFLKTRSNKDSEMTEGR